ncbi:hypothetical protein J2Z22_001425 [Paenibacillus forsythiae]|uniref:Uncharacterized protein n=1 Tax=Paenibacillus forsythiae TaxID=365616 RepID=A0ABU3H507_9BACL|nr:hypothetical protein [Paenibacillus forsythiae]MDT3425905.1 hypothetical protein [Paenibacillus forsythiae]
MTRTPPINQRQLNARLALAAELSFIMNTHDDSVVIQTSKGRFIIRNMYVISAIMDIFHNIYGTRNDLSHVLVRNLYREVAA